MKILDRYLLRTFLGIFAGSLVSVSFLFTVLGVLDSITYLMDKQGASFVTILRYYGLQLPQTIYMGSPVAALLASMITLGTLNQNNELTAMRAGGISMARAATPILFASVIISMALFELGNTLVPVGNRYFISAREQIKGDVSDPGQRVWYISESNDREPIVMRIEKVERDTGRLHGLTMFHTGPGFVLEKETMADSAEYDPATGWKLDNARTRNLSAIASPIFTQPREMIVPLPDKPEDLIRIQRAPEEMTLTELNDQIKRVHRYGLPETAYRVERQARFAIPLATIILVLVGAPLSIRPVRSGGIALSILGAIMVGFGYFVIIAEFISLGKGGLVSPLVAAWTANIIFGVIGIILFSQLKK